MLSREQSYSQLPADALAVPVAPDTHEALNALAREAKAARSTEEKRAFLKRLVLFTISSLVFLPVLPASEACMADEKCVGILDELYLGPLTNEYTFKVLGSLNMLTTNGVYAFLEGHRAWDYFYRASPLQKLLVVGLFIPVLCAQEFIFATTQGTSGSELVAATFGATASALFTFMQLKEAYANGPWQRFKWEMLLGSACLRARDAVQVEMLYYANLKRLFIQKLKQAERALLRDVSRAVPQTSREILDLLLNQPVAFVPENLSAARCHAISKYSVGLLIDAIALSPNIVNTYNFLTEHLGNEAGMFLLNGFATGVILTKNIYATTLFLVKTTGAIFTEIQNKLTGRESEWLLFRFRKKTAMLALALTSFWTLWTYQTQFSLWKKNLSQKSDHYRYLVLSGSWYTHNILANTFTNLVLSELFVTNEERALKKLQQEIARLQDSNYENFRSAIAGKEHLPWFADIKAIAMDQTPGFIPPPPPPSPTPASVASGASHEPEPGAPLIPAAAQPTPAKSWLQRFSLWCCGSSRPTVDPDAVVVDHKPVSTSRC